jgi:hypothetical protein
MTNYGRWQHYAGGISKRTSTAGHVWIMRHMCRFSVWRAMTRTSCVYNIPCSVPVSTRQPTLRIKKNTTITHQAEWCAGKLPSCFRVLITEEVQICRVNTSDTGKLLLSFSAYCKSQVFQHLRIFHFRHILMNYHTRVKLLLHGSLSFFEPYRFIWGYRVVQLVAALRCKSKRRGFDSRWGHCNFSLT